MGDDGGSPVSPGRTRRRRFGLAGRFGLLLLAFALPAAGALLNLVAVYRDGTPAVPDGLDGAAGVAISPVGRHVYAVGREDDALVVFVRDATAETLSFVEVFYDQVAGVFGLEGASAVTVSPDSRHVYTTAEVSDALAVFVHDASTDTLAFVEAHVDGAGGVFGLDGASGVAVSDDSRHVYATASTSDALTVFVRDASLDSLAFADAVIDGVDGADGLAGARSVAYFSYFPTVNRLFVAAPEDDSLAVLVPDPQTDTLSFLGHVTDGVGGVDGLDGAAAVVLAPDGMVLYVAGRDEDALAVFDVDGTFHFPGQLLQVVRNGQNGVTGLAAPAALALSADGGYLYAAGAGPGGVTVFRRELDGRLTFLPAEVVAAAEAFPDPPVLDGLNALAVSPEGKHVLTVSRLSDALALYRHDAVFSDGFESGDLSRWGP